MNITKLVALGLILCVISGSAYATGNSVKDSIINLDVSSNIAPTKSVTIETKKLAPGTQAQISCNITDTNNKVNRVILMLFSDYPGIGIYDIQVNNKYVYSYQFKLTNTANVLSFVVYAGASITITNLDQTDSVTINNCFATHYTDYK